MSDAYLLPTTPVMGVPEVEPSSTEEIVMITEPESDAGAAVAEPSGPKSSSARSATRKGRNPVQSSALAIEGTPALHKGKIYEAEQLLHRAFVANGHNDAALAGLAENNFDLGRLQSVFSYAEQAVAAAPKVAKYRILLIATPKPRAQRNTALELGHPTAKGRLRQLREQVGE